MFARIVLVEDETLFLEYVRELCIQIPGYHIVGTASDGAKACEVIAKTQPDIVLLDLNLPKLNGFQVMERTREVLPWIRFVVLSVHIDTVTLQRVEKARVGGYLEKGPMTVAQLRLALETVLAGRAFYSPTYQEAVKRRQNDSRSFDKLLSSREQGVLKLIGVGLSDEEIAAQLGMAVGTVETHRKRLMHKLDLSSRAQLAAYAIEHGFTQF